MNEEQRRALEALTNNFAGGMSDFSGMDDPYLNFGGNPTGFSDESKAELEFSFTITHTYTSTKKVALFYPAGFDVQSLIVGQENVGSPASAIDSALTGTLSVPVVSSVLLQNATAAALANIVPIDFAIFDSPDEIVAGDHSMVASYVKVHAVDRKLIELFTFARFNPIRVISTRLTSSNPNDQFSGYMGLRVLNPFKDDGEKKIQLQEWVIPNQTQNFIKVNKPYHLDNRTLLYIQLPAAQTVGGSVVPVTLTVAYKISAIESAAMALEAKSNAATKAKALGANRQKSANPAASNFR